MTSPELGEYFSNHSGGLDASQSGGQSTKIVSKPFVVYAKQVQNGCLEIADVNRILDNIVREVIRFAVNNPSLDTAPRHP